MRARIGGGSPYREGKTAMSKLSRREFLKTISLTTGAVVINQLISGCTDKPQNNIDQGYQSEPEESKRLSESVSTIQPDSNQFPDLVVTLSIL